MTEKRVRLTIPQKWLLSFALVICIIIVSVSYMVLKMTIIVEKPINHDNKDIYVKLYKNDLFYIRDSYYYGPQAFEIEEQTLPTYDVQIVDRLPIWIENSEYYIIILYGEVNIYRDRFGDYWVRIVEIDYRIEIIRESE